MLLLEFVGIAGQIRPANGLRNSFIFRLDVYLIKDVQESIHMIFSGILLVL
jgi:hypothetical protein